MKSATDPEEPGLLNDTGPFESSDELLLPAPAEMEGLDEMEEPGGGGEAGEEALSQGGKRHGRRPWIKPFLISPAAVPAIQCP